MKFRIKLDLWEIRSRYKYGHSWPSTKYYRTKVLYMFILNFKFLCQCSAKISQAHKVNVCVHSWWNKCELRGSHRATKNRKQNKWQEKCIFCQLHSSMYEIALSVVHSTPCSRGWLPPNDWQMKQMPWGGVKLLNNEPANRGDSEKLVKFQDSKVQEQRNEAE